MKLTIYTILLLLIPVTLYTQSVRTETASNKAIYRAALTSGDTIFTTATSKASGSAIRNINTAGFVVGVLVGEPVASDTIIIMNGAGVVATIVQPSTGMIPQYYPLQFMMDTSCIFIQKKASKSTLTYRLRF